MNEESIKKHLQFISNAIQEAHGILAVDQGFWLPYMLRDKPHYENYWADGYEFTFYLIYQEITVATYDFIQSFLMQRVYKNEINFRQRKHFLISFGGGVCHFQPVPIVEGGGDMAPVRISPEISRLKTRIKIPTWFDSFIYNELSGKYSPDYKRYATNLDLNEEEVKNYLGTYCLRSLGEAKLITENLLFNNTIKTSWQREPIFKILDFGSGTGGNLAGIILALKESFQNPPDLEILSIDGNKHMLSYQKQLIEKIKSNYPATIDYQAIEFKVSARESLEQIAAIARDGWNYIITFKCLSEIPFVSRIYLEFCKNFAPLLADNGLMLILDVTTKDNLPEFNPILMNKEISEFEKSNSYRTLLPLPCAMHSTHCEIRCFTQQQFLVSHSRKNIDKSKVAYRVIGHEPFVNNIISILPDAKYIVKWNYSNAENPVAEGVCPHCSSHENTADGYLLN